MQYHLNARTHLLHVYVRACACATIASRRACVHLCACTCVCYDCTHVLIHQSCASVDTDRGREHSEREGRREGVRGGVREADLNVCMTERGIDA